LDAFLDIFMPSSEVWKRLRERKFERPEPLELDYWARVSVFLARDRLKAVVDVDEDLFRRVLRAQALVLARSAFLLFSYQFVL
jgi:hypothetical protein